MIDVSAYLDRINYRGPIHPPVETPWGGLNVRLQAPDGLQVTLFQSS